MDGCTIILYSTGMTKLDSSHEIFIPRLNITEYIAAWVFEGEI